MIDRAHIIFSLINVGTDDRSLFIFSFFFVPARLSFPFRRAIHLQMTSWGSIALPQMPFSFKKMLNKSNFVSLFLCIFIILSRELWQRKRIWQNYILFPFSFRENGFPRTLDLFTDPKVFNHLLASSSSLFAISQEMWDWSPGSWRSRSGRGNVTVCDSWAWRRAWPLIGRSSRPSSQAQDRSYTVTFLI